MIAKILFVCHGNICRSTMAQSIFSHLDTESAFFVDSAATSYEEIGNPMYPPARRVLAKHGIPIVPHRARRLESSEYGKWDLFVCFDDENLRLSRRILGGDPEGKIRLLLNREIDDPWYTDDFETAYDDINAGCRALRAQLRKGR